MNRIEKARNQKDLMKFQEACQFFRVSKPTLLNALKSGEISGFKIGRRWRVWRYPPKEGLKIEENRKQSPTP